MSQASSWSVGEVAAHLLIEEEVDEEVVDLLREKGVDGPKLLALTEEKLVEMGVGKEKERTLILDIAQKLFSPQQSGIVRHDPTKDEGGFGLCGPHKLILEYYCEKCDKLTCAECMMEAHQGHTKLLPLLAEHSGALREELEGFVPKLGEQSAHIEKVLTECGAALEMLANTTTLSIEKIVATRDNLIKALHEASESAIAQVREHEASKRAYLQRKVEQNLALKKDTDSLKQDLSQFLKECSSSLVMQQRDAFKASCAELLGEAKARSIAQLDAMKAVGVKVDEEASLEEILELIQGPLYEIAVNGISFLTGGVSPLGVVSLAASSAGPCTRIVALGGDYFDTAELYDGATKQWTSLPNMLFKRDSYPAIGFSKNKIYVAGGLFEDTDGGSSEEDTDGSSFDEDFDHSLASAEVLDLATLKWTALTPMRTKRRYTSGVFFADGLWFLVTGGSDDVHNRLSSCEVLDTTSNTWTSVASLSGPRSDHCSVLYKGKPVVLGGSFTYQTLNTCEEYDPENNKWTTFPSFNNARVYFGAAVVDGMIYIAGGVGSSLFSTLDSIEVFDGVAWSMVSARLAKPRSFCAAVCLGNKLVVLGGKSEDSVEVYDPATNTVASDLVPKLKVNPKRGRLAAVSF